MSTQAETSTTRNKVEELAYRDAIRIALDNELGRDDTVVFFGEDVASDGGVFKTNAGLAERYGPERVFNTPICENSFIGMALGMSTTGLRPVVEIMFSDFLPTAADALVNELPKFRFMSGGQTVAPVTIRSMGGGAGRFGTQHSATGESWYMMLPGMRVATASTPAGIYAVLRAAIRDDNPTLVIEHKALFGTRGEVALGDDHVAEIGRAEVLSAGEDVTVVATLLMAKRAGEAAAELAADGVGVDLIDLRWIRPLDMETVTTSLSKTGRLVIVEEQHHAGSWGATLISRLTQAGFQLKRPPTVVGLDDEMLIPYSPELEDAVIPTVGRIAEACRAAVRS